MHTALCWPCGNGSEKHNEMQIIESSRLARLDTEWERACFGEEQVDRSGQYVK
jgi:hypothetical protein